jgi:ankyrin repeat protein
MLQRGANPNASNRHKETALYLAAAGGHSAIVKALAEADANVNG